MGDVGGQWGQWGMWGSGGTMGTWGIRGDNGDGMGSHGDNRGCGDTWGGDRGALGRRFGVRTGGRMGTSGDTVGAFGDTAGGGGWGQLGAGWEWSHGDRWGRGDNGGGVGGHRGGGREGGRHGETATRDPSPLPPSPHLRRNRCYSLRPPPPPRNGVTSCRRSRVLTSLPAAEPPCCGCFRFAPEVSLWAERRNHRDGRREGILPQIWGILGLVEGKSSANRRY